MVNNKNIRHCKCGRFMRFTGETATHTHITLKSWDCKRCRLNNYVLVDQSDYSIRMYGDTPVIIQHIRRPTDEN